MGGRIGLAYPRTAAALILTLAAVAIPCTAWYIAGQHQVDREAQLAEKNLYGKGLRKAVVQAEHLATRFEVLRESESRRAFYHYQNLFHDPKGAAQGLSVSVSPLAQSQADPLIEAHFQVDEKGQLSLPTLNETFPELGLQHGDEAQCELLWKLKDVAIFCDLEAETGFPIDSTELFNLNYGLEDDPEASDAPLFHPFGGVGTGRETMGRPEKPEIQWLSAASWNQHLAANDLYADLKLGRNHEGPGIGSLSELEEGKGSAVGQKLVSVSTGSMEWRTLPVGGVPSLVAMRAVETPAGTWTQGFTISGEAVAGILDSSSYPTVFEPRTARNHTGRNDGFITVPIDGTPWQIRLDIGPLLSETEAAAAASQARFLRVFMLGALGAGMAAMLLVFMFFHSERLALQRAQFAAAAAHELRTPLAGLRLYGEMLAEGLGDPSRSRDYARRMAGEAERLGRVVTNVLSFTRLEQGGFSVNPAVGDLQTAVMEAYQRQKPALDESGAQVDLRISDGLPPIRFDRDAVTHIVQNLLDNAEKYTRDIQGRRIVIGLSQESEEVVLSVADNGNGVPKSLRRSLFRPFTRGGSTADSPEGLGLGLVLVRMLARAQGAEITYRDAPAGGAEFRVAFPVAEPAAA